MRVRYISCIHLTHQADKPIKQFNSSTQDPRKKRHMTPTRQSPAPAEHRGHSRANLLHRPPLHQRIGGRCQKIPQGLKPAGIKSTKHASSVLLAITHPPKGVTAQILIGIHRVRTLCCGTAVKDEVRITVLITYGSVAHVLLVATKHVCIVAKKLSWSETAVVQHVEVRI